MIQVGERASEVRQHFSEFIDGVVRDRPGFVIRNRDAIAALNLEHIEVLLSTIEFHVQFHKDENGDIIGTLEEVDDLVVCESSKDEALQSLANDLIEYAEEYLTTSFKLYFNAPNRRNHFPYVLKVATQPTAEHVTRLLHARP